MLAKLATVVNLEPFNSSFERKGALATVEIGVLCGWRLSNQFEMALENPFSCNTAGCGFSSELYFARCCALNRSGTICNRKQGYEFILSDFKK